MKTISSVYNLLNEGYLSITDSSQVAKGTVFRKHTVLNLLIHIKMRSREMFKFSWYENLLKNSESYLSSFTKNAIIYYYYLLEYF